MRCPDWKLFATRRFSAHSGLNRYPFIPRTRISDSLHDAHISYAVFCLKKKTTQQPGLTPQTLLVLLHHPVPLVDHLILQAIPTAVDLGPPLGLRFCLV